jgi:nicotinamide-nucleotide amidase
MPSKVVLDCSQLLADKHLTIAFAESATAGRLAAEFSLTPTSGKVLIGGLVCYDANVKKDILGVPEELVEKFTPESAEITEELARRLQKFIKADIHIGITGLTTPGGSETPEKPVGSMFIHAMIGARSVPVYQVFQGKDEEIVLNTIDRVAQLLIDELK